MKMGNRHRPNPHPRPAPPQSAPPPSGLTWTLAGRFILEAFDGSQGAVGAIGINYSATPNRLRVVAPVSAYQVWGYDLPAKNTWDPNNPATLSRVETIARWDDTSINYVSDLFYGTINGTLDWWCKNKVTYDSTPPSTSNLYAQGGTTININLPRQNWQSFIKRGPSVEPYIGGGGSNSGQGWSCGFSIGKRDGTIYMQWPQGSLVWSQRAIRDSNYYPVNHIDNFIALDPNNPDTPPRTGGRWASDNVLGSLLLLSDGYNGFAWTGTGVLDYASQNTTFAATFDQTLTYQHRYSSSDYSFISFTPLFQTGPAVRPGKPTIVLGSDWDGVSTAYLAVTDAYQSKSVQIWAYTLS